MTASILKQLANNNIGRVEAAYSFESVDMQSDFHEMDVLQTQIVRARATLASVKNIRDAFINDKPSMDVERAALYRVCMESVLMASDLDLPVTMLAPSFESSVPENYSTEAEEKSEGFIGKIWAWIKRTFTTLMGMLKAFFQKLGLFKKNDQAKNEALKKKVDAAVNGEAPPAEEKPAEKKEEPEVKPAAKPAEKPASPPPKKPEPEPKKEEPKAAPKAAPSTPSTKVVIKDPKFIIGQDGRAKKPTETLKNLKGFGKHSADRVLEMVKKVSSIVNGVQPTKESELPRVLTALLNAVGLGQAKEVEFNVTQNIDIVLTGERKGNTMNLNSNLVVHKEAEGGEYPALSAQDMQDYTDAVPAWTDHVGDFIKPLQDAAEEIDGMANKLFDMSSQLNALYNKKKAANEDTAAIKEACDAYKLAVDVMYDLGMLPPKLIKTIWAAKSACDGYVSASASAYSKAA